MEVLNTFKDLFLSVWMKGIMGVDFFQIIIGLAIFFLFLVFSYCFVSGVVCVVVFWLGWFVPLLRRLLRWRQIMLTSLVEHEQSRGVRQWYVLILLLLSLMFFHISACLASVALLRCCLVALFLCCCCCC